MSWYREGVPSVWETDASDFTCKDKESEHAGDPEQARSSPEPAATQRSLSHLTLRAPGAHRLSRLQSTARGVELRQNLIMRDILADADRDYWIKIGVMSESAPAVAQPRRVVKPNPYARHRLRDDDKTMLQAPMTVGGPSNPGGVRQTASSLQAPQPAAQFLHPENTNAAQRTPIMTPSLVSDSGSSPMKPTAFDRMDALNDELLALKCAEREFNDVSGTSKGFLSAQAVQLERLEEAHAAHVEDTPHHGEKGQRIKFGKAKEIMLWHEYMQTDPGDRKDLQGLMDMTTKDFESCYGRAKREYTDMIDSEFFAWYREHLDNEFKVPVKTKGKRRTKDFYDEDSDIASAFGEDSDEDSVADGDEEEEVTVNDGKNTSMF